MLGGLPGNGKTTLAFQIAENMRQMGGYVVFYSYEMSVKDFVKKKKLMNQIQPPQNTEEEGAIDMVDAEEIGIDELVKDIEEYAKLHENFMVVIDYLQIIPVNSMNSTDIRIKVEDILEKLCCVAKKMDIPIIVISSLNREAYKQKQIEMWSFKETSNIDFRSTIIWGIESDDDKLELGVKNCRLRILKNKYGTGKDRAIPLWFDMRNSYFFESKSQINKTHHTLRC